MGDAEVGEQLHLLLGGAHEQETTGKEQEGRKELEAVLLVQVLRNSIGVAEDKANLDDAGQASGNQSVAKDGMDHGGEHERLRVARHAPAGECNDHSGDKVALGSSATIATEPDADETGGPPDDAHGRVLQVIVDPGTAPAVLGKGIDAAPCGDDERVEEFLTAACAFKPGLTDKKEDGEQNAVGDEGGTHDEVSGALARVVAPAEAEGGDASEQHLHPGCDGNGLANDTVGRHQPAADLAQEAALDVEAEVDAQSDLDNKAEHQPVCELGMGVGSELAAFVSVTEEVADDGEDGADDLDGNVEA